jgi:trimeric autotransporter adhesin
VQSCTGRHCFTVHGTLFTGVTSVQFGTRRGTHVRIVNARELKVTAPDGTGTVNVTVTSSGGTSATSRGDRYRYR